MIKTSKGFLTKKNLITLIASVVILTLLIVLTATGVVHKPLDCPDCTSNGEAIVCETCNDEHTISTKDGFVCPDCDEGLIDGVLCSTCDGDGTSYTIACPDCCETCGGTHEVQGSFWALIPPIIAIGLALITKEVFSSLFVGILSGAILINDFSPVGTVDSVVNTGLIDAVSGTAGIFIFLIELGILVALINRAGGSKAFGDWAQKHVKTKVGAALCSFVLGILIFIDDYFNCLTVGSVMRPITDKHKISRSKLAYLIDATAAPICMIAPISSWAAAVSQYAQDGEGFKLFIMAIPFNFYSILTIVFVLALILMKFDFGPMKKHELNAQNGDLFSGAKIVNDENAYESNNGRLWDLVLPIIFLLIFSIFALVYVGGIFEGATLIEAFADTDATVALPWGGLVALALTMVYLVARKNLSFKECMESLPKGFIAMVPAIFILTFATALKNMTGELGAAYYIGDVMHGSAATLNKFLPAIIFLVACLLAFATGTSWGTFGILIPIVTAMFAPTDPLGTIGISACLAGAVCGDHCSPISDTTIMSSAGAECEHLNHVYTQIPYAIFVAVISFVSFIIAGFIQIWYVALPISIIILLTAMFFTKILVSKR